MKNSLIHYLTEAEIARESGRSQPYVAQARRIGAIVPVAEVSGRFLYPPSAVAAINALIRPVFGDGSAPRRRKRPTPTPAERAAREAESEALSARRRAHFWAMVKALPSAPTP